MDGKGRKEKGGRKREEGTYWNTTKRRMEVSLSTVVWMGNVSDTTSPLPASSSCPEAAAIFWRRRRTNRTAIPGLVVRTCAALYFFTRM
jgi:hypothetical protein